MVQESADFNLPDNCWELVFKFLMNEDKIRPHYLMRKEDKKHLNLCLSLVSKQFLSIINLRRFSLTIFDHTHSFFSYHYTYFHRFPNLTSLNLIFCCNLDKFDMLLIADGFPNLQLLNLNHSHDISKEGIGHVLRRCCKIRHLNLANCYGVKLPNMNFEVPKLEVLNLSYTNESIDDETLYVISKSCRGLLHLVLEDCKMITEKGVMCVVENCTRLREINLKGCVKLHANVVVSMVRSRPSLRTIIKP